MRIRTILAATVLAAVAAPAFAADIASPEPLPMPDVVAAPSTPTWSGFYLGALFGYDWGESDISGPADESVEIDGIEGGAFVGANYQLDRFVVGAEADLVASGADGAEGEFRVDQGLNGSLRGRVGLALDQFLLYGTGGIAATSLDVSNGGGSDEETLLGWTAGVGGEALITESITARVEYRYTDYQDKEFTLEGGAFDSDLTTHTVRAGVGVKF